MGFKDDVRAKAVELEGRVSALETLAAELKRNGVRGYTAPVTASALPTRTPGATVQASTNSLDYGAIAFGLSEIKAKVSRFVPAGQRYGDEYKGAVNYFADVFAKADPGFDRDAFKRQAGV